MDTACVRPFNLFGPRQLANGVYGTVVSSWLDAIKHGKELRSDGDGSQTRDMTHVSNVVDVFARVGAFKGKLSGHSFNAGTGVSISNNQIMAFMLSKFPEARERVVTAPWRAGDVRATQADVSVIRKNLGFDLVLDFWKGLEETIQWSMNSPLF
jgi:nucleoside-diphosphate-sugar epimerase